MRLFRKSRESSATGDSSSITKYVRELFGKCGLFMGHKVAASLPRHRQM